MTYGLYHDSRFKSVVGYNFNENRGEISTLVIPYVVQVSMGRLFLILNTKFVFDDLRSINEDWRYGRTA